MQEQDKERLSELFDRAHVLLLALDKCKYHGHTDGGKLVVSGIIDFISRCQDEIEETVHAPGSDPADLEFITDKTELLLNKLKKSEADSYESPSDIIHRWEYEAFVSELSDPITHKYLKTVLPNRQHVVRHDVKGNIQAMFYIRNEDRREVRDGPFIYYVNGEPKEIGYYRDGKPVGIWITVTNDGHIKTAKFKDPKWFYGDPKRLIELYESYKNKYEVVEQEPEENEDVSWGAVLAGSLAALTLGALFSKKTSEKTTKKKEVQQELVQEI